MKKKKRSSTSNKVLDPNKTKKLLILAGILIVFGILLLSYLVQYGLLTNETGMTLGWVILGICAVLLLIDSLAQDKWTKNVRLAGVVFGLVYVFFRYFY